jgi:putative transcriptional regulator
MPIRVKLDRILVERRMSLTELADRVGVTVANLSILKTGKARAVRFSTLDALCRALDCQPGELIAFEPGPPDSDEDELESLEAERSAPEGLRQRMLGAGRAGRQKSA